MSSLVRNDVRGMLRSRLHSLVKKLRRPDASPASASSTSDPSDRNPPPSANLAFPRELWWLVIDALHQDWHALLACTLVCQAWYVRARLYLPRSCGPAIVLSSRHDVLRLARVTRATPLGLRTRAVHVHGDPARSASLAHLGALATMLAGRLPALARLHLRHGAWRLPPILAPAVPRRLAAFGALRELALRDVVLPSTTTLARLLGALRALRALACVGVRTARARFDDPAQLRALVGAGPRLEELVLGAAGADDVLHFFGAVDVAARCDRVEIGPVGSLPGVRGPRWEQHANLFCNIRSVPNLVLVFDASSVSAELVPYLTMVLQHCDALETLRIRVSPLAFSTTPSLDAWCAIPAVVTRRFSPRYITVHPSARSASAGVALKASFGSPHDASAAPDPESQDTESEEIIWARYEPDHFGVRTAFAHFTIPSHAGCARREDWIDQIKAYALEAERAAGLRCGDARAVVWMRYARHAGARPWFYPAVAPGLLRPDFPLRTPASPARFSQWRRTYVIECPFPVGDNHAARGALWTFLRMLRGRHAYVWAVEER